MKAVIQRVSEASVSVDNKIVGKINYGLLILLGVEIGDTHEDRDYLIKKIGQMRIFNDENQKMNLDIKNINGEVLIISQFTLLANTKKGNRPSYISSEKPELASQMYLSFCEEFSKVHAINVERGIFAADMKVYLVNDGPVTITLDSRNK